MSTKRSRVHPKYKTKYRVSNWSEYDRSLVRRGNITVWLTPDAVANWSAPPTRRRGGQPKYSDLAIETALTLRLLFHLPLRQAEGFLVSIFALMDVHLDVPDHTRRWCVNPRRWCVDRREDGTTLFWDDSVLDRVRRWSTQLGHAVEHGAGEPRFRALGVNATRSHTIAEDRLVPEEGVSTRPCRW